MDAIVDGFISIDKEVIETLLLEKGYSIIKFWPPGKDLTSEDLIISLQPFITPSYLDDCLKLIRKNFGRNVRVIFCGRDIDPQPLYIYSCPIVSIGVLPTFEGDTPFIERLSKVIDSVRYDAWQDEIRDK